MTTRTWGQRMKRDFLALENITPAELRGLLDLAISLKT